MTPGPGTSESRPAGAFDVGVHQRVGLPTAVGIGFQNILGLAGLLVFPGLLGRAFALGPQQTAYLYGITFMTSGLVVVLQSVVLLRLPVVQGPFAGVFAALIVAGHQAGGLGTAFGSLAVAGLAWVALAVPVRRYSPVMYLARYVQQPLVSGVILLLIATQLAATAMSGWLGKPGEPGFPGLNLGCAALTAAVLLACTAFRARILRRGAVLWALIAGTLAYTAAAPTAWGTVLHAGLFTVPRPFPFGFGISPAATVVFFAALFPAVAETMATYRVVADWTGEPLPARRMAQGVFGEVAGSTIGAVFGGMATLAYPDNVSLLRITRVASRWVTLATGIIMLALGGFGYFDAALVAIPQPALSGATAVLFGILFAGGLQVLSRVRWNQASLTAVGVAFALPAGALFLPAPAVQALPPTAQLVLQQPLVTGALLALAAAALTRPGQAAEAAGAEPGPSLAEQSPYDNTI